MGEFRINGKTVVTQTGSAEPEIGGNVLMHSNAINTALSGATFPAGHVVQVVWSWAGCTGSRTSCPGATLSLT